MPDIALKFPLTQASGTCLNSCWYSWNCPRLGGGFFGVCPYRLMIYVQSPDAMYSTSFICSGRPPVGYHCAITSDTYTTVSLGSSHWMYYDIWKAYQDGVWTSSTTIQVCTSLQYNTGFYANARTDTQFVVGGDCPDIQIYKPSTGNPYNTLCPTNVSATLTVTETGAYSWS